MGPADQQKVETVLQEGLERINAVQSMKELDKVRVEYLGKSGRITAILRSLGDLPEQQRPVVGRKANQARDRLEDRLEERRKTLEEREQQQRFEQERIDITLPGRRPTIGHLHPTQQVIDRMIAIFQRQGFSVAEGPEVEWDYYNFEALNIPQDHPARDMQDSFYITHDMLLRTQTSPVQIRYMEQMSPALPVRIIAPGRVFRRDDDATHSPVFHQVEGLAIDREITMADLKGVLYHFATEIFGEEAEIRLRPSYFPFTEPSAELDVSCPICGGTGCRTCGRKGWVEILGSGMVHPKVLKNGGYDPREVSGFAFGIGVERIAMIVNAIDDLRVLYDNDLRALRQF